MSHKIAFREYGHGPILVLLHGYGGGVMHWDGVIDRLQDRYRVVVPNLTHLYLSKNRLLFPVIVDLLADFLKTNFPGEKVSLAGLSFGGSVAWGVSVQHPQLVHRLLLFNPMMTDPVQSFRLPETRYFFVMPMNDKSVLRLLATPIGESFLRKCARIFRPDREAAGRALERLTGTKLAFVAGIVAHFSWILRNEDWKFWRVRLAGHAIPTAMMYAKDDQLFADSAYEAFAHEIKALKVDVLEEGGHILSRSRPDDVARACLEFLAKPEAKKPAA